MTKTHRLLCTFRIRQKKHLAVLNTVYLPCHYGEQERIIPRLEKNK